MTRGEMWQWLTRRISDDAECDFWFVVSDHMFDAASVPWNRGDQGEKAR